MRTALIAALAALNAAAVTAEPAYAQRDDRGRHERRGDDDNDNNGRRGEHRRDDGQRGDHQRGRRDDGQQAQPAPAPQVRRDNPGDRARADLGGRVRGQDGRRERDNSGLAGGNNGRREWARDGRGGHDAREGDRRREGVDRNENNGRRDWARDGRGGHDARDGDRRREWNDNVRREQVDRSGDRDDRADWEARRREWSNRDGDNDRRREWNGRDGRDNRGDWNGRDGDRRGDWDRDRRREHADNDHRGGRDWSRHGRRDWRDDDNHRREWDRSRHDDRYRRYWHTHSDFRRPRYSDWRHVRHGYYFDRGYASILRGYYGRDYYWWSYGGWHRPHRRWSVGYVIPAWLWWEPLPWDLYYRLPPAPYGCRYVYADGDILLIAIASGIILDALIYDDGGYYRDDYY